MGTVHTADDVLILPLRGNDGLVKAIAEYMNLRDENGDALALNQVFRIRSFSDGSPNPKVYRQDIVKGKRVILVDTYTTRVNMNERAFARLMFSVDALKRSGAAEVNLASFPLPYARQDEDPADIAKIPSDSTDPTVQKHRKKLQNMQGESFAMDAYNSFLHNIGIKRIFTSENHNPKEMRESVERHYGTSDGVLYNLDPFILFGHLFSFAPIYGQNGEPLDFGRNGSNVVMGGIDLAAHERVDRLIRYTGFTDAAVLLNLKNRRRAGDPTAISVQKFGDRNYHEHGLEGKILLIPDDMFDSGGSVESTLLDIDYTKEGVPKYVLCVVPYPINSGEAFERIQKNHLNIWTTTFRPNISQHGDFGAESITPLYMGRWLADEFSSIMSEGKPLLVEENFPNLSPAYLSRLYELRNPSRMVMFTPNTN